MAKPHAHVGDFIEHSDGSEVLRVVGQREEEHFSTVTNKSNIHLFYTARYIEPAEFAGTFIELDQQAVRNYHVFSRY